MDFKSTSSSPSGVYKRLAIVVAGPTALVLALVVLTPSTRTTRANDGEKAAFDPKKTGVPAIAFNTPPTVKAEEAKITDNAMVVGVTAGGKHRAYYLQAFTGNPMKHLVNDVLGDVPITVAACDRTQCVKVFTDDKAERGKPLFLVLGGYRGGRYYVRTDEGVYDHGNLAPAHPDFPPFPYQVVPAQLTTWKAWREAHPDTDVYVGLKSKPDPRTFTQPAKQ